MNYGFTGFSLQLGCMALCTWVGHDGGGNVWPRKFLALHHILTGSFFWFQENTPAWALAGTLSVSSLPSAFTWLYFSCHMGLIQTFPQRHIMLEFNILDNSASNSWCPHLISAFPTQASSLYHSTQVEVTLIACCSYFSHVKVSLIRARAAPSLSFLFPSSVVL